MLEERKSPLKAEKYSSSPKHFIRHFPSLPALQTHQDEDCGYCSSVSVPVALNYEVKHVAIAGE